MPTLRDIQNRTLGQINSLTTAVKFSKEDFIQDSASFTVNPIEMLVTIFKALKGYDWLIEKISQFIVYVLPGLEWSVKSVLLANLQAMVSCSINPIITKRMITEGVVFDTNQIDLLNILRYSPLDTNPSTSAIDLRRNYYYFGCTREDGVNYIDDLKNVRDFNAVLWYSKNTPDERIVWRRKKDIEQPLQLVNRHIGDSVSWFKQPKSNGIVTIEYNRNSDSLTTSEALPMSLQEPMENCMHVYIGCNVPLFADNVEESMDEIADKTRIIADYDSKIEELESISVLIDKTYNDAIYDIIDSQVNVGAIENETDFSPISFVDTTDVESELTAKYKEEKRIISFFIEKFEKSNANTTMSAELDGYVTPSANGSLSRVFELAGENGTEFVIPQYLAESTRKREISDKVDIQRIIYNTGAEYPSATSNYYYLHPLVEFNTDFVLSMDPLFDAKVVTAQLIDALTGLFSMSANVTIQMQFIQAQIRELVEKIITSEVSSVNDCFFSFTNDTYNAMLQQVELARVGLQGSDFANAHEVASPYDVMDSLNNLSLDATKEEVVTAIEGALFKAVSSSNPHGAGEFQVTGELNGDVLTNLLMKLVYVLVETIISPKIYILLMMNMKIMEEDISFDLKKFIMQFKDMIVALIQSVKNEILDWFIEQLNVLVKEIAAQLATTLVLEQYQYYIDLLNKCVMCFRLHRNEYDWAMDDVDYADITELTETSNAEC